MDKKFKAIQFEIKEIDEEERSFLAVASTEDIDRDNDRIMASGWDLANFKKNPVIPWSHRYGDPPVATAKDIFVQDGRLMFRPKFATKEEYEFADTIYKLYKGGFLRSFSVGFQPKRYEIVERDKGRKGYDFLEQELWEVSACTVPSNPNALVAAKMKGVISQAELEKVSSEIPPDPPLEKGGESLKSSEKGGEKKTTLEQYIEENKERLEELAAEGNIMARVFLELDDLEPDEETMRVLVDEVNNLTNYMRSTKDAATWPRMMMQKRLGEVEKRLGAIEEALKQKPEQAIPPDPPLEKGGDNGMLLAKGGEGAAETPKPETLTRENLIKIADAVIKVKTKEIRKNIRDELHYHLGIVD